MERCRLSVQIENDQKKQIEERIKKEYPKVKNISELVRAALKQFLESK
jgi:Arc/MetJ-type ribon-helix-helix transcriptional regulator